MSDVRIGKNVLENLTVGMYKDSSFVYREYIQNSADSIDKAINENILQSLEDSDATIKIDINREKRIITIEDRAMGIEQDKVMKLLRNVADSTKNRDTDKGFRGIGRLGGLAYCKTLIFETSYKGENVKSILTFDADTMQTLIDDKNCSLTADEVVDKVTSLETEDEEKEKHYFKVILKDIKDSSSELLDVESIKNNLCIVAPVQFNKTQFCPFAEKIEDFAKNNNYKYDSYKITVNGDFINKPYCRGLYEDNSDKTNRRKYDEIKDIKFKEFFNTKGELLAWMWIGISNFPKQIPQKNNPARGIRIRKHNIQFGDSDALKDFFREQRGTGYFIGELNVVHKDLIPNARRDYFNDNDTIRELEEQLKLYCKELYEYYRIASQIQAANNKILDLETTKAEYQKKQQDGFDTPDEKIKLEKKIEEKKEIAEKATNTLESLKTKSDKSEALQIIYNSISAKYQEKINTEREKNNIVDGSQQPTKTKFRTQQLSKLNKKERKMLGDIFGIIDDVLPDDLAKQLKDKIEEYYK